MNCRPTFPRSTIITLRYSEAGLILPLHYFADTAFWIALFRQRDQYHHNALAWRGSLLMLRSGALIVTTEAVCWEWMNVEHIPFWRIVTVRRAELPVCKTSCQRRRVGNKKCDNCSMAKHRSECVRSHCIAPPFLGGLCERHHEEDAAKRMRLDSAMRLLERCVVDNEVVRNGPLRNECDRLHKWWSKICDPANASRQHPVLGDETEYASSWCIDLADQIAHAERGIRARDGDSDAQIYSRQQTWKRFENLERGLMSNGVNRPAGVKASS